MRIALAAGVAVLVVAPVSAHTRSQSSSSWRAEGRRLEGTFSVDARRATLLYGLPEPLATRAAGEERAARRTRALPLAERVAAHLRRTVRVRQGGDDCTSQAPRPLPAARGYVRVALAFACPEPFGEAPAELAVGAFFPVSASHVHLLRLRGPSPEGDAADGAGRSHEAVLGEGAHRVGVGGAGPVSGGSGHAKGGLAGFLALGAEHVLGGADHLAFLAALLLLCAGAREVLLTVTGFTAGHSATLALAVLGWIEPSRAAVEALIGFSVAFAAAEALAPRARLGRAAALLAPGALLALPLLALALPSAGLVPFAVFAGLALFALCRGVALGTGARLGSEAPARGLPRSRAIRAGEGVPSADAAASSGRGSEPIARASAGWVAPALAAGFGLAHGAGFAGALLEMEIPRDALLPALLGFNLGVEAGQLVAVALLGLAAALAGRALASRRALLHDAAAAGLLALGTYWLVERSLGA